MEKGGKLQSLRGKGLHPGGWVDGMGGEDGSGRDEGKAGV